MKDRRSQSGVALVITLIMLSVITLIAVAFLALSQRERASISSTMTATEAEQMANAGLDRSIADILAQMSSFIATNINQQGQFTRLALGPDLSVSLAGPYGYNHLTNMGTADYQVLTNLLYDPPAPIYATNWATGDYEHVYYLDLNRNGRFDPTGFYPVLDNTGWPVVPAQTNFFIGDPQWIGVTVRPNERHSGSNRFAGRYAYLIVPAGRTHNIDYIHNDTLGRRNAGFFRNRGHGSWELNLAALLADLNTNNTATNGWGDYRANFTGIAFDSAFDILNYRYQNTVPRTARDVFGVSANLLAADGIDLYGDGDATTGLDNDDPDRPWPGASNPQHFFTINDYFNPKPLLAGFQTRLQGANNALDSYNRHTFYRMLAQLARDSAPEKTRYEAVIDPTSGRVRDDGPININYVNNTNDWDARDFVAWHPTNFFHTAADRLLRDHGFGLSVKDLQLYPRNDYTPAVHRILQLALNIYDATTTNRGPPGRDEEYPFYPTALKPIFDNGGGNLVRIVGYRKVERGEVGMMNSANWYDLTNATERSRLPADGYVYGVPILIGAKKGYPNFNEFAFQTEMQVERKLQLLRPQGGFPNATNHMFLIGVSNFLGIEIWNSYTNPFPRALTMFGGAEITRSLYNDEGFRKTEVLDTNFLFVIPAMQWGAHQFRYGQPIPPANKGWVNDIFQPYAMYQNRTMNTNLAPPRWETTFPTRPPQWVLSTTNRLRFFLFDDGYLVDAVALGPTGLSTNVTKALAENTDFGPLWQTNLIRGVPAGIFNQIQAARPRAVRQGWQPMWDNFQSYPTTTTAQEAFEEFLTQTNAARTVMQVPYTPQVKLFQKYEWRANDPLVHYIEPDLRRGSNKVEFASLKYNQYRLTEFELGKINAEYAPWGGPAGTDLSDQSKQQRYANYYIMDAQVTSSDAWEFPTNKLPSIGWLGRVHRGTPWQTINLKPAPDPAQDNWMQVHYSMRAHPTNDWRLLDLFTVAQHPNATRGRMSVNQTNLAGWSGLLSGVEIPMLDASGVATNLPIEPAFIDPRLDQLVTAINGRRQQLPGEVFASLAEFVSVPELTIFSPYLAASGGSTFLPPQNAPFRDADYEAIPQKIASLVKRGEPRFEIYVFGQSLKPAPQSVLMDRNYRGLCINYEVTGELAARAVVRVDLVPVQSPAAGQPQVRPRAVIESFNLLPLE